jgi:hypothetical protein
MSGTGFLAIWSDVTSAQETDYLHWLTREHTAERLGVSGFLNVRVYRCSRRELCRYFIHYELQSPEVLGSDAYLARLDAPTPWSRRIMPTLGNFLRGGGRVVSRAGVGQGCILAAIRLDSVLETQDLAVLSTAIRNDRVVAAELLETNIDVTSIQTREARMRAGNNTFGGLLLIEGLDEDGVSTAIAGLPVTGPSDLYTQIFSLQK